MNCKVSIRHRTVDPGALAESFRRELAQAGISPQEWRGASRIYANLDGIENQFIWGGHLEGGRLLFAFLRESANRTLIWIEHNADSQLALDHFKLVIRSGIRSLMRTQGWFPRVHIEHATFYQHREEQPLGLRVTADTAWSSAGRFDTRQMVLLAGTGILALMGKVGSSVLPTQANLPPYLGPSELPHVAAAPSSTIVDQLGQLDTYSEPALLGLLVAVFWNLFIAIRKWSKYHVEVNLHG